MAQPLAAKHLLILGSLYLAQGLPFGFFTQAMPTLLREQGVDLRVLGMLSMLAIPWALKFLWAPLLDRISFSSSAHRRGWILLANLAAVTGLLVLSMAPLEWWLDFNVVALFALLLGLNFCAATQDIATDALAVESIPAEQRGFANGLQIAGYRMGMVIGGGLILGWIAVLEWQGAMWAMAAILLMTSLTVWAWGEEDSPVDHDSYSQAYLGFFKVKSVWAWIALLLVYKAPDGFGSAMLRPMLVDIGATVDDIAWLLGTCGVIAGLIGALLGGWLVKPIGRYRALWSFILLHGAAIGSFGFIPTFGVDSPVTFMIIMCEHVLGGMSTVALFVLMMDFCRPTHSGVDYSLQSCLVLIGGLGIGALSGLSAHALDYDGHYGLTWVLTLLATAYVISQRKVIQYLASKVQVGHRPQ